MKVKTMAVSLGSILLRCPNCWEMILHSRTKETGLCTQCGMDLTLDDSVKETIRIMEGKLPIP